MIIDKLILSLLFAAFITNSPALALPFSNQAALYNSSDPIVLLSTSDFKKTVLGTNHAWLIEFYSSWCGHCIDFAPAFRTLSNDVKGWGKVIKIGAVDCAKDENSPICREYEVMAYPTLKFFPAFSPATQLGLLRTGPKKVDSIRHSMVTFVEDQIKDSASAPHWPVIDIIGNDTLSDIWNHYNSHKSIILLFEQPASEAYWSRELILDLQSLSNYPPVRRVGDNRADLAKQFGVTTLPSIVIIDKNGEFERFPTKAERESTLKMLHEIFNPTNAAKTDKPSITKETTKQQPTQRDNAVVKSSKNQVFMSDLEKAILYSLSHEVITHKLIDGRRFDALKDYVNILDLYFPGRKRVKHVIRSVKKALSLYEADIKGEEFANLMDSVIESEHPNWRQEVSEWQGCRGSQPHLRGYPCSLWTLFHVLTVSFAAEKGGAASSSANGILTVIKGYVQHFFGCSHCSEHFVSMAESDDDPIESVSEPNSSIMWLWRAHNKVNKRLAGDSTEDPQAPKIQFPSSEHCQLCHANADWNHDAVLQYLTHMYSLTNISMQGLNVGNSFDEFADDLAYPGVQRESAASSINTSHWNSLAFNRFDISLCALVYIVSPLILLGFMCRIIFKRRYRKKMYIYDITSKF